MADVTVSFLQHLNNTSVNARLTFLIFNPNLRILSAICYTFDCYNKLADVPHQVVVLQIIVY